MLLNFSLNSKAFELYSIPLDNQQLFALLTYCRLLIQAVWCKTYNSYSMHSLCTECH
jgi:hypothetical protein